jgi:hypothetical protein
MASSKRKRKKIQMNKILEKIHCIRLPILFQSVVFFMHAYLDALVVS